ncbi:MAG TPA: hypothetical protein VD793_12000, partial [Gemmatimonadales bacterium]|nr:hypothetical protein [Gemmatimonadales bacterium]
LLACESSVSSFDPAAATEAAGTVVTALQQSPAFQTMSVLGDDITVGAPPAPLIWAALPNEAFAQGRLTDWARLGAETLASHADLLAPIFPSDLLGKTFTYNLSQSRYEVSTQPGAPATGVRFVLYAVNIVAHTVQQPLNPVGYLDLTDLSDPSAAVLGVKIVINNATLLDYQASATFSTGSIAFGADGSISDGQTTVEFDLTQSVTSGPTIAVDYRLAVPEEQVELELVATITAAQSDINLTIAYQGTTTIVHAEGNPNGIVGMITHNDALVVNIAGTPDNPVFTDPSGAELSPAQIEALQNLFDSTDALLDAFDELLGPAHRLLGIPL